MNSGTDLIAERGGTHRVYDEKWIGEQLAPMLEKGWTEQEIAGWFARVGFEDGKMLFLRAEADEAFGVGK